MLLRRRKGSSGTQGNATSRRVEEDSALARVLALTRRRRSGENGGVRAVLVVALWTAALAGPAHARAQDAAADAAATDAAPTPSSPEEAEAIERFADAQAMFERGDHLGALAEMERIYQLLEGTPNQYVVLYNLGRVYEELFQYDRAVQLYQRYLADAPADATDRADAEASLRALERLLGTIVVRTNGEGVHVWIGESDVGTAPGELRVSAGHQVLELRAEGFESVRREIDVVARQRLELDLPMHRLSDFRGLDPAVLVGVGVSTGVVLIAGIVVGSIALVTSNDAGACVDRVGCSVDVPATRRTIQTEAITADVLYGTAGALAVTSIVLAFLTDFRGDGDVGPPGRPTARVLPAAGGLVVDGRF